MPGTQQALGKCWRLLYLKTEQAGSTGEASEAGQGVPLWETARCSFAWAQGSLGLFLNADFMMSPCLYSVQFFYFETMHGDPKGKPRHGK